VLCNLAIILTYDDELQVAESHFQEALSVSEGLVTRTPERYRIYLGMVLHNYSLFLLRVGRKSEAYTNLRRAVEIKRELVKESPGIFEPNLVVSLRNLLVMLQEDNSPDLEKYFQEVLDINKQSPYASSNEIEQDEELYLEWEELYGGFGETP
jgi:tetratricopeptide (TPR) repeat protein